MVVKSWSATSWYLNVRWEVEEDGGRGYHSCEDSMSGPTMQLSQTHCHGTERSKSTHWRAAGAEY
jgi:hypothetical protein